MWASMSPVCVHVFVLPLPIYRFPLRGPNQVCSAASEPDRHQPAGYVMHSTFPKSLFSAPSEIWWRFHFSQKMGLSCSLIFCLEIPPSLYEWGWNNRDPLWCGFCQRCMNLLSLPAASEFTAGWNVSGMNFRSHQSLSATSLMSVCNSWNANGAKKWRSVSNEPWYINNIMSVLENFNLVRTNYVSKFCFFHKSTL